MFVDGRSLPEGVRIEADLCIIGAGAAGITLALELAGRGLSIALLESGGFEFDDATQDLCRGELAGYGSDPLEAQRLRYFGGTTNHWAGNCWPLEPHDLTVRPWIAHSGWPFDRVHLDPFYRRAFELCEAVVDGAAAVPAAASTTARLPLDPAAFAHRLIYRSPPTRFNQRYRGPLGASAAIKVYLHANALGLEADPSGHRVDRVRFGTLDGKRFVAHAKRFVLACGGIENARLLLLSNGVQPKGLGNGHDLVGRFFMDHPHLLAGNLMVNEGAEPLMAFYDFDAYPRRGWLGCAVPTAAAQREGGVGGVALFFGRRRRARSAGERSLRAMLGSLEERRWPEDMLDHVGRMIADLDDIGAAAVAKLFGRRPPGPSVHTISVSAEAVPDPDSRVTLVNERDALGLNRVKLDWRLDPITKRSIKLALRRLGAEVGRRGLGRVHDALGDGPELAREQVRSGPHHIGTTRMHPDPKQGVVDADFRVHGLANLYITGSSVFPTSGATSPTLTVVALAARLARHFARTRPADGL
jgi:choline dehydrogenase-like flavoprotein